MKHQLFAISLLCAVACAPRAFAAIGDQSMDPAANNGTADQSDDASTKPVAPPSATPGSKADTAPAAAATADAKNLGPNEALFDAISRGDLTAARDAVSRGADLNAQNSLGQKPVDASIDLGRNEITFMLLAQRPLTTTSVAEVDQADVPSPAPASDAAPRNGRRAPAPAQQLAEFKPAADPGTPEPSVGFLGF